MKHMKNVARLLTLVLVLCMVFLPLVSCKNTPAATTPANQNQQEGNGNQDSGNQQEGNGNQESGQTVANTCTVVLETDPLTVYTVDLDKVGTINQGLVSVFEYLKNTEEGFDYNVSNGWTNSVGPIEYDANAKKSPYYWTSVEADQSPTPWYPVKEYAGVQLIEAQKGPNEMTVQADAIYYIGIVTW